MLSSELNNERWPILKLNTGSTLHGFTIESEEAIPEFDGIAYKMKHTISGARLLYLKTDDENKAFAISFKTPPTDNTGVFHILEHSVLSGSKKFPVKEPFVNLLKSSMQTFLNAMTFPDKTMYPVASTNEQDLLNLMDVYMDAVLHPSIYDKKAIFEQEGWHFEIDEETGDLRYNGVVFNEMKGALSDPDAVLYNALAQALFPDTTYAFESGGDPAAIPDLTYENFLDNHRRHYRLDNSYILLYGDMHIERQLAFLDENYLSIEQQPAAPPNKLEYQQPVKTLGIVKEMNTAPENACIGLGYVVGNIHERERIIAIDILIDALMGSNEAPLKRALLDSHFADDVQGYFVDGQLQPVIILQAKGCKNDCANAFLSAVESTVDKLISNGIPQKRLEASLSRAEFAIRERDFGIADGVLLAMQSVTGWLYDDSMATAYLHYEEAFAHIRDNIDKGYFEELLRSIFVDSKHMAQATIKPVEAQGASQEVQKLTAIKASLSPEELSAIEKEADELKRIQQLPDSPEALATLPMLQLKDIGEVRPDPDFVLLENTGLPCLFHDIPTRNIAYVYHYFDLDCIRYEELPYVGLLMRLLGKLDTREHTAEELDSLIQTNLGGMRFFVESYGDENDPSILDSKFVVAASALSENIAHLVDIPSEIWATTLFDDTKKIKDSLQQSRIAMEQEFASSGHTAALSRASSYYVPSALIREQLAGIDFYRFLKDLLNNFDEQATQLVKILQEVAARLFVKEETVTSFTGSKQDCDSYWERGKNLRLSSCTNHKAFIIPSPVKRNEAFIVPSDVCFVAKGYDRRYLNVPYSGVWQVASRILSYDYLWSEIRAKGGAYGAGFKAERSGGMQFYSYRDPNLDSTLQCFDKTSEWLASFDPEQETMLGYIISTVAGFDSPKKPREIARRQDAEYFSKLDPKWRTKARNDVLETTAEQLRDLAPVFKAIADEQAMCVFGSKEILEKTKNNLSLVDLLN